MKRYHVKFISRLAAEKVGDGETHDWRLIEPLWCEITIGDDANESAEIYVVPAGFRTDFATVPRAFYALAGDVAHKSATLHDWLLRERRAGWATSGDIFLAAMRAEGVVAWRRWIMWAAVRAAARFIDY